MARVVIAAWTPGQNWLASGGSDSGTIDRNRPLGPNIPVKNSVIEPPTLIHEYTSSAAIGRAQATRSRRLRRATGRAVRSTGLNWAFAPTVAVVQNERWGRSYESFSADPAQVRVYAKAYVEGLQGDFKSPGDVTVLRDKSAANLYVAVLQERSDPLMSGSKPNLNAFLEEFERDLTTTTVEQHVPC